MSQACADEGTVVFAKRAKQDIYNANKMICMVCSSSQVELFLQFLKKLQEWYQF